MENDCKLIFRDTPCKGMCSWVSIQKVAEGGNYIRSCSYHAAIFSMIIALRNIYSLDRIERMTLEEITEAWETGFGTNTKRDNKNSGAVCSGEDTDGSGDTTDNLSTEATEGEPQGE